MEPPERGRCNLIRRIDFALFMVEAFENDELVHEAPGDRRPPDALGARTHRQRLNSSVTPWLHQGAPGTPPTASSPRSAKSCEPEGPQDLTRRL